MPSPVIRNPQGRFYRRKDGAWVIIRGTFVKVGKNKYRDRIHYSKRNLKKDRKRRAKKAKRKLVRRYPHEYD